MTDDTTHTCSYECERPGCIRAQRDELVARLTAETGNARGKWVLVPRELLDEARNIAMEWTLKGRVPECGQFGQIAQDLDAMLADAPQPRTLWLAPRRSQTLPDALPGSAACGVREWGVMGREGRLGAS